MSVHNADDQANAPRFYSVPPEQMVQRPPKFSGDDDVDPMDFLDAFESACDWNNWVTDHRKLMVVRQCLTGSARRRMEKLHGDVVGYKEGKEKSFLARFRKEYVTSEWLAAYRRAYSRREQQEGETASKYFMTMLDLLKRADPNGMTREGDVVAVIRGGLLPQYTFHFMTFAKLQESKVDNEEGDITLEQLSEILKMVDQCTTPKIVRGMDHVIKPNNRMGNSIGVHAVDYGQKRNEIAESDPFESRINARLQYMENEMFNFMDRLEAKFGAVDAPRARNAGPGSECYNCHENGHSSRECINPSTRSQQVRRCTWRTPGFSVGPSTSGQEGQTDKRNPEKLLKRSNDKKPVLNNMVGCIEAESIEREYVPIYAAEPSNTKKEGRTEKEEAIYQQRLKNLAKARAALNEQRKLDKEAVARGEVAPSLIKKAMKQVPTIMDPQGQIRKFNMEQALWNMTVPVPFPQLMYHAPELRLEVLDKMGAAPKIAARVKREEDPSDAMETNTSSIVASKGNRKTEVSHVQVDTTAETFGTGLQTVLAAVEDETIAFLVDGGASVSILPKYWIDKLGKTSQIQKPVGEQLKVLRFGGGDTEETVGVITLDLLMSEDVEVRQSFYVVMNQHTPCILGIDFLTKARVMFDAEEQCLYFRVRDTEGTEEDTIYVVPTHPGNGRGGNHAYDGVLDADENHVVAINVMNAENGKEQIVYLAESLVLSSGEVQFVRLDLHEQAKYWDHEQMLESGIHLVRKGVVMIPAMLAKDRPYYVVLLDASEQSVKLNHGDMLGRIKPVKQKSTESIDIMTSMEEIVELLNHLYRGTECYQIPSVQEGPWFLPTTELVTSLQREHQHVIDINSCVLEPASEKAKSSVEPQDNDSRLEGFDIDKGLDSEQKRAIQELIIKYRHVFATSLRDVQAVKAPPYKIQLKENATPKKVTPRMVPHDANLWFKGFIEELLAMNLIEPCTGPWAAAVVLIPADRDKRKPRRRRKFQAVRNPPKLKLNKASDPVPLWSVEINVADGHYSDSEAELSDEPSEQIFQGIYPKAPPPRKKANDIEGQRSEFTSVVPKGQAGNKDPYRLCLDYQPVNAETVDSAYPIPNINFLFTLLTGAKYFTLFDALKGYWQLELDEESRDLTGFTTTFGQFRWTRLPMGLKGAPGAWQSVVNDIFSEELLKYFVIYSSGQNWCTKIKINIVSPPYDCDFCVLV
ncbi:hypothetical protein G6F17_010682 [Rhizopus arrhizus]|nr:hypothetical protein G6F17_010682 [Rhizopus arrhizus]